MNIRPLASLLLACALPAPEIIAAPAYPEASLPELARILETVPERAPELISQGIQQEESTARLNQARAAYYPRLDLGGSLGYRYTTYNNNQPDEDTFGLNFNATLRRPLYHWGAIEARIRQARLDYRNEGIIAELALRRIERDIRADYLSLLVNQTALRNAQLRRQVNEERAAVLRSNASSGTVSSMEAGRTELNLSEALMDIEQLEADQARILANYRRKLGWEAPLALDAPLPQPDTKALLAWIDSVRTGGTPSNLAQNPEILHRLNLVEREKAERIRITAAQRPLFNFAASAGQGQSNTSTQNNVNTLNYFAGIDVSWNIFDGFETRNRKLESRLRQRRLENDLAAFQDELASQAGDTLTNLAFQARRLELSTQRIALSRDSLASNKRDLDAGRLAAAEYKERELALQDEELELLNIRAALLMGITDYLDLVTPLN
ncbi:MAG: TolC family protein [Verrucomicrobiota bacterium]